MMDRPIGDDAIGFQLGIVFQQIGKRFIFPRHMVDANHPAIILVILVRADHAQIGKSKTVMLIIEGQKGQRWIAVLDPRAEHRGIPAQHFFESPDAVYNMEELGWGGGHVSCS